MQVLADRTEFYWTHLSGIGALENSLWAWDGKTIRIWLNALTIETSTTAGKRPAAVKESVAIVPDFYPLCACSCSAWRVIMKLTLYSGFDGQGRHHRR